MNHFLSALYRVQVGLNYLIDGPIELPDITVYDPKTGERSRGGILIPLQEDESPITLEYLLEIVNRSIERGGGIK